MSGNKILLVDDDPDILEFIEYNLRKEGFEVTTASNGNEAIEKAAQIRPDLILLDVMMPEMDGVETCAKLRTMDEVKNSRIAFLTARGEDYSQIAGFDAGGDDYILKPVKPRVLVSRIKALLRRSGEPSETKEVEPGLQIDLDRYEVTLDGTRITLPRKEFELLSLLMSKPGKVFTRENILTSVWGDEVVVGDRTIDVHIRKLREKLGNNIIQTIKGVGYKFNS
jgi:two-component system alkaline phosphatase synthesis response regulator PhoP